MGFIKFMLVLVQVLSAILLIVIILLQKSKDEGLGLAFGSAMGESLFGSRAGNVLTKITVILASVFLVCTFLLAIVTSHARVERGSLMEQSGGAMPGSLPARAPAPAMPDQGGAVPAIPAPDAGPVAVPAMPVETAPVEVPAAALPAPAQ